MTDDDILCEYQAAEERGVVLLRQLQTFAPTPEIAAEIGEQIKDELKHELLFSTRLKDLDIDCEGMHGSLERVYDLAQEYVDQKDWVLSIAIQASIEELAMSTFTEHFDEQDAETQVILKEIIEDEARHLAFGIRELEKVAKGNEEKIRDVHLAIYKIFSQSFNDSTYSPREHKMLIRTVMKAYKVHKSRLRAIGIEVPKVREVLLV